MPVFAGDTGGPNLTIVDRPYLKPAQTFTITIKNYQGRQGATTTYRLSEVSFYGNEQSQCSDTDKVCNPNKKILGIKLAIQYTDTMVYLVLGDYFGYTTELNIKIDTISIPAGSNIKFTVQIGNGKIVVKRGDTVMISTSYSQPDPIVNVIYYRVAQADTLTWTNANMTGIQSYVAQELWNVEYQIMGFSFDIGKLLSSVFPLIIIGGLIPALVGIRGKAKG